MVYMAYLALPDEVYKWILHFLDRRSHCTRYNETISSVSEILATCQYNSVEKKLLNSNISTTSSQYGELRSTNGCYRLAGLGHASKFNGFRVLASLFSRFDQQHSTQGALQLCISERERELYNAVACPSV